MRLRRKSKSSKDLTQLCEGEAKNGTPAHQETRKWTVGTGKTQQKQETNTGEVG
jgi:hypothetical protein